MARLDEYRKKRHFGTTPEPEGEVSPPRGKLLYVIQKHASSHLHWDFRIELDGVLLSWAVPKGPSLDPHDKRLAMHVEDHPVEYGSFEGVIPKGEYGGGTVMLWDRGTWEPDHGDPRKHLAEGHLKFYLFGERLRGRWMLVRSKGYGGSGKDSWLLFKERDDEVRTHDELDATAAWVTSVATGRTMDEIASDVKAVWHSNESVEKNVAASAGLFPPAAASPTTDPGAIKGAKKAAMPGSLDVELATLVKDVPEGERWIHEVKYDGYRILAYLDEGKVRLISRNGKDWTSRFPKVSAAVATLPVRQAIVDGEVVVLKPDGTSDFQALQNHARRAEEAALHYMIFDLLYLDGYDLRSAPLAERKRALEPLLPRHDDRLAYADHVEGHGDVFYSRACEYSLEGVVSKRSDAPYRSGRGRDWVKTKCLLRQEFVVVGYTDPGGSRQAFGALVLGLHENSHLKHVGRVGTGFTEESLRAIHGKLTALERKEPPVANPPTGAGAKGVHWVEPELVAEVAFAEWTGDDSLRHPSFMGLREDKPAEEVSREAPVEPPPLPGAPAETGGSSVAEVALSNPDRVLWPELSLTKLELARYYESIAELMLPHIADRPLSLVRCPSGYTAGCFYHKHIENFPKSVATVGIYEPGEDKTLPYARIRNLASVIGLVQMGVLEIHPWGSRADAPDKPDRLIFDLDPDPDLRWSTVTATALLLRSELGRLGLDSWVKTTGGKGIHVVVPIRRTLTWDEARAFAKSFVESIVAFEPRLLTSNMSKAKRGGRIFIDYLRNARGATAIGAYSSRARPDAPVSVPLFWEELEDAKERRIYNVRNLGDRLRTLPGDPWSDIASSRQSITSKARAKLGIR